MQSLPTFFYFTAQGEEMNACKDRTLLKQFAKYVSLSVLAMVAISCYILADTYFISLKLGETGLSALNLALPVYYFIHGTGLRLGRRTAFSLARCILPQYFLFYSLRRERSFQTTSPRFRAQIVRHLQ